MFPVSSNLRTRRHQMKPAKASFETEKGNPFSRHLTLEQGLRATEQWGCWWLMHMCKSSGAHSKTRTALRVVKCQVPHTAPCSICESPLVKHHFVPALPIFQWGGCWSDQRIHYPFSYILVVPCCSSAMRLFHCCLWANCLYGGWTKQLDFPEN